MNIVKTNGYESLETNGYINQFETKLLSYSETQAKHNASENMPNTEPELKLLIMNHVHTEVSEAIEKNKQHYSPISGMVVAQKFDTIAKENTREISAELQEDEHMLAQAENMKKENCPNIRLLWVRRIIYLIVAFLSSMEGLYIYEALRSSSFPKMAALISAIALALGLGILTHVAAKHIKRSISWEQRLYRYRLVLIPAFIGFYFIGHLRAAAYTTQAQLNAQVSGVIGHSAVSGWGVTIICFLTFLLGLIISVKYAKTKAEDIQQNEYDKACREYNKHFKEVRNKKMKISEIQNENHIKTEQALSNFECALAVEKQLKIIAQKAMNIYAVTNIRHRKDGIIPVILSNPPAFEFTTFFENLNNK